ncbi:MAG: iron-containing alcohol dehydrogenase [Thiotrichales bacterium]
MAEPILNPPFPFSVSRLPRIEFGAGSFNRVPTILSQYGRRVLVVTGARSFLSGPDWRSLQAALKKSQMDWATVCVAGEPSPQLVDEVVVEHAAANFDVVLGVGGGSALDAAKAIAGLLRVGRSVMDYLEGVGPELSYQGPAVPFVAVPTTAGTGSEATKNAVLSVMGPSGFKKSFRDDQLVAAYAIVDPDLLASCPREVIAANGMDALTQLLESYVSLRANPFTDALAVSGLRAAREGLLPLYDSAGADPAARERMAYAAMLSGITLAQVGLGSVHGLASPLGAFHPIPHGVVCGTLVAAATEVNIRALCERDPQGIALQRYARLAEFLTGERIREPAEAWRRLVDILYRWTDELRLPPLARYGVAVADLDHIVAHARGSSMRTNPIELTDNELKILLQARLDLPPGGGDDQRSASD